MRANKPVHVYCQEKIVPLKIFILGQNFSAIVLKFFVLPKNFCPVTEYLDPHDIWTPSEIIYPPIKLSFMAVS